MYSARIIYVTRGIEMQLEIEDYNVFPLYSRVVKDIETICENDGYVSKLTFSSN